ncbi:MAG: AsmA family protein, partial [Acetobacteraceae bacterium]|nr:AsmA family protein [Acetobacteraceae bacterium]
MARATRKGLWIGLGLLGGVALLAGGAVLFAGALAKPFVESALGDALQRPVSIGRLHLSLGRQVTARAEDLVIGNPPGFPDEATPWLARVPRAVAVVEAWDWLRGRPLVIPRLELDRPRVEARGLADGQTNYIFHGPPPPGEAGAGEPPGPRIDAVILREGSGRVAIAGLAADFAVTLATVDPPGAPPRLLGEAQGTYAGQPIIARLDGGALLALQDASQPWPLRLDLTNGPVRLLLEGTLREPLALRGADLRLTLAGPDMALLAPLTGVPFAATPPFRLAGQFDYAAGRVRLLEMQGEVGRTDVAGGM